jgi:ribonuclease Y
MIDLAVAAGGAVAGVAVGFAAFTARERSMGASAEKGARKVLDEARTKAKETLLEAKEEASKVSDDAKADEKTRREQIAALEQRLATKEETLDTRSKDIEDRTRMLTDSERELDEIKKQILEIKEKQQENLAKVAKLKKDDAKKVLMEMIEKEFRPYFANRVDEMAKEAKEGGEEKAKDILAGVIQRVAPEFTTESSVATVAIPNDEMKGRIIGKEGRNIHSFERATGMDIIVDDTPGMILISGFDPVRRHVAKVALEKLIQDGRIHPTRIEEVVAKVEKDVEQSTKEEGEKALQELGITGVHPDLVKILGRLNYRTSYGQNVLRHSVEAAHIAAILADEINADVMISKTGALFHDIGKALDHELEGSHVTIGCDIAKKYGLSPEVIHCIAAHHEDIDFETAEAMIVQTADAISGARPGARRESLENYIKRIKELEDLASAHEGVDKAYAIQAGREVRVIIQPNELDELGAARLAKDIAKEFENNLKYPGQIKVQVIRETRTVEYAK